MAARKCTRCGEEKPLEHFPKHPECKEGRAPVCKACGNTRVRAYRARTANAATARYEKTKRGFLMRLYRNMQSRVSGVQRQKFHLYAGKTLGITREQFYEWGYTSAEFHALFEAWELSGYSRGYTPSADRIDSSMGYELDNMQWVTHSENSRRGNQSRIAQGLHRPRATHV